MTTNTQTSTFVLHSWPPLAADSSTDEIVIVRANGHFVMPASALIKPEVVGSNKGLFQWRGTMILDDERIEFEAESFYSYRLPCVWHERNLNEILFSSLADDDFDKLLDTSE